MLMLCIIVFNLDSDAGRVNRIEAVKLGVLQACALYLVELSIYLNHDVLLRCAV